jgi:hypothetical protein
LNQGTLAYSVSDGNMKRSSTGNHIAISPGGGEQYRAFVPKPDRLMCETVDIR